MPEEQARELRRLAAVIGVVGGLLSVFGTVVTTTWSLSSRLVMLESAVTNLGQQMATMRTDMDRTHREDTAARQEIAISTARVNTQQQSEINELRNAYIGQAADLRAISNLLQRIDKRLDQLDSRRGPT